MAGWRSSLFLLIRDSPRHPRLKNQPLSRSKSFHADRRVLLLLRALLGLSLRLGRVPLLLAGGQVIVETAVINHQPIALFAGPEHAGARLAQLEFVAEHR